MQASKNADETWPNMTDVKGAGEPLRAVGRARIDNPETAFSKLNAHILEHGVEAHAEDDARVEYRFGEQAITLSYDPARLIVELEGPSEGAMVFLRQAAAEHFAELVAETGADLFIEWDEGQLDRGLPPNFQEISFQSLRRLAPGMARLTFAASDIGALRGREIHFRVFIPKSPDRDPVWPVLEPSGLLTMPEGEDGLDIRYYTVRTVNADNGTFDMDIVLHGDGAMTRWVDRIRPGARLGIMGPAGGFLPPAADFMLIGGDMTALPALARMLEEMPDDRCGHAVLCVPEKFSGRPYAHAPKGMTVELLEGMAGQGELEARVKAVAVPDGAKVSAWFAGEFDQAQNLRKYFKGVLGLKKDSQLSAAYWRRGIAGNDD